MKLNDTFILHEMDDACYLVPVGSEDFKGIVRCNKSAAFVIKCLGEDTDEEKIVDAMCDKYDAPRADLAEDVKKTLDTLRGIHALVE